MSVLWLSCFFLWNFGCIFHATGAARTPSRTGPPSIQALKTRQVESIESQDITETVGFSKWPSLPIIITISTTPPLVMTYIRIAKAPKLVASRTEEIFSFISDFQEDLNEHYSEGSDILPRKVGRRIPDPDSECWWDIRFETEIFSKPQLTASVRRSIIKQLDSLSSRVYFALY